MASFTGQPLPGANVPSGVAISPGGAQGLQGGPGLRGAQWFNGAGPPPTPIPNAIPGDYYLDTTSGDIYVVS
jgi:hypothetical protein